MDQHHHRARVNPAKFAPLSRLLIIISMWLTFGCDDDQQPTGEMITAGTNVAGTNTVVDQGQLRIDRPQANQILATGEVVVEGTHSTASEITINGMVVPVVGQRFLTSVSLPEGPQQIVASAGEDQVTINILVDATSPYVQIIEPTFGAHIDSALTSVVTVVGQATDEHSGIERVEVNGQEVLVESNGRFQFSYTPEMGLRRPFVIARDRAGNESSTSRGFLYGRFKQWTTPLDRGARGEIRQEAFEVLEETIERALKGGVIEDLIAQNMINSDDINIEDISFQDLSLDLEPRAGFISASISFYDLRVFFELNSPRTRGDVYISPATLDAELHLFPKPDGTLDIQVRNTNIALQNLDIQVDNSLLDAAISFVEGFVRGLAEDALLTILEQALVGELLSPDLFSPELQLLDVNLRVRAILQEINITPEGMLIEAGVQLEDLPIINDSIGYLYMPPNGAPPALPGMATLDLQQNTFNLFFSHLWRGGLLNFTIAEVLGEPPAALSAALLNGFTDGKLTDYMSAGEIVGVRLRPSLPPIVRFDVTRSDAFVIDFVDLMIDLTLPDGTIWFTGSFDMTAMIVPRLINNQLGFQVEIEASAMPMDEPIFPVKSRELLGLIEGLLEGIPSQLGPDGISDFFDLNDFDFYGLTLSSSAVKTVSIPTPYLQVGLRFNAPQP